MRVKATPKMIDKCFEGKEHQADALVELYKIVHPEWDKIVKFNGFPKSGAAVHKYICRKFQEFDRKHHPNVMQGGIWLNNGFSTLNVEDLDEWEIESCKDVEMED